MTRTFGAATALAVALTGQAAFAAPLTTSQTVNYAAGGNATATDTTVGGSVANASQTSGASTFNKFDTDNGVLTGVTIGLNGTQSRSLTVGGNGGSMANRFATGSGSSTSTFSTPTGPQNVATSTTGPLSCGGSAPACPRASSSSANVSATYTAGAGDLNAYAASDPATFDVARTINSTVSLSSSGYNNPSAAYTVGWGAGSITTTYSYLTHANGSFAADSDSNSLTLDFGELFQGDAATDQSFNLFNLGDASTAGLDLDSIIGSGDTGAFSSSLATFFGLAAGTAAGPFTVSFNTSALGNFLAIYTLNLSDQDVGYGMANSQLVLNLTGRVVERPVVVDPVPEPAALGLFGLGLFGLGALRRRKSA